MTETADAKPDGDAMETIEEQPEPIIETPDTTVPAEPEEQEQFPRAYVEELRAEAKSWRVKAQKADGYAQRLHTELVKATGRLADPTDVPFDEAHLSDPDALATSIDVLLQRKPHLASRKPVGDVGQGVTGKAAPVDLVSILRRGR